MFYSYLPNFLFGIGTVFFSLFLYSILKQNNRLTTLFALMSLSISIYVFAYGLEILSNSISEMKLCLIVEYFGVSFLPVLWLLFSYKFYTNKDLPARIAVALGIIPFITLFMISTNDYHHLFYKTVDAIRENGYLLAVTGKGPFYILYVSYTTTVMIAGICCFFLSWKKTEYSFRTQSFWLFIGSVFPLAFSLIYIFGRVKYDIIPFSFSVVGLTCFVALFRYDFLELKDIVRGYAFSQINEGIFVIDDKNRLIDYNAAGKATFSWLRPHNVGISIDCFAEGKCLLANNCDFFDLSVNTKGGVKTYEFRVTPIKEKDSTVGKVFLFQDVTENKMAVERLNYMATYDTLSEIYNRSKLMEEVERIVFHINRYGGNMSVLMLDIDHFKSVNDKYGHLAGDLVIKGVAQNSKSMLRNIDIIGRYGGEEFLIILPGCNKENAMAIAEEIRTSVEECRFYFGENEISITVSIGVVSVSGHDKASLQEIIKNADTALYIAKDSGRNTVKAAF
ncbi:MAG: putative diguanylate cyclase YegE [Firmicutes bacterium ADurb.Bin193]|nr:MAG: putative diguanylate cyclase YegE [Firmicutes bacterium ADurb.Bin193]